MVICFEQLALLTRYHFPPSRITGQAVRKRGAVGIYFQKTILFIINKQIQLRSSIFFITLAGTPPTSTFSGTDLVTTLPAATTEPMPMVTPHNIVQSIPIQTTSGQKYLP